MHFNNLRRNILAMLGESWSKTGERGNFSLEPIRTEFADIPESDFEDHLDSLVREGYIKLSADGDFAELTPEGVNRLKIVSSQKGEDDVVVPKKL